MFGLSHTKIIDIESATGTTHRIALSHMGDDYELEFSAKEECKRQIGVII